MRSNSTGGGQFFWTTQRAPAFGPHQRLDFTPSHDGDWHEYAVPFEAAGPLKAIRIDPSTAPGTMEFEWIHIEKDGDMLAQWRFTAS
jgi:hypothetical protein